jgi:hypothetical protein
MCKFFSVCSIGDSKPLYFDAKIRKQIIAKKKVNGVSYESTDSHTSIADYFGHKGLDEDKLNKYEYNVWTKKIKIDHLGAKDDSKAIKDFCDNLDWTTIVPELRIKPIINPFKDIQTLEVTKEDIKLLKEWDSVWASVGDSVGDSVWDSVWASVRASVWDSVWASVWDSVWDSVWASVGDSVWASVWAYIATFVDTKYKYNLTPAQKLWERGLVASFDGENRRLHGKGGKEVYKISRIELRKIK